jgi:type VI secretion system secreted protein Hcp
MRGLTLTLPKETIMALNAYLKLDGIDGESQDKGHSGEIEILSFSWGVEQTISRESASGAGAGKVTIKDITITKHVDKSSPMLMNACATGQHIKTAQLEVVGKSRSQSLDLFLKLEDILVSSVQLHVNTDSPMEVISLNFTKVEEDYVPLDKTGQAGVPVASGIEIPGGTLTNAQ